MNILMRVSLPLVHFVQGISWVVLIPLIIYFFSTNLISIYVYVDIYIYVYILTFIEYLLNVRCQALWWHLYTLIHLIISKTSGIITVILVFLYYMEKECFPERLVGWLVVPWLWEAELRYLNSVPSCVTTNYCLFHWIHIYKYTHTYTYVLFLDSTLLYCLLLCSVLLPQGFNLILL